jgi:hypothetical protein
MTQKDLMTVIFTFSRPAQSKEKENKTDGKFLFVIICIIVLVFTYLLT